MSKGSISSPNHLKDGMQVAREDKNVRLKRIKKNAKKRNAKQKSEDSKSE